FGMALQAIREDSISAAMAGINVVRERIIAWLLSALIAGLAGGVFAWYVSVFYPETVFSGEFTIFAIVFALFGGTATVLGPIFGVLILYGIYNAVGISTPQYFQLISGLYRPEAGEVHFEGRPIAGLPSHRLVHLGINRTFQVPKPFLTLSVRQNVEIAIAYGRHPHGPVDADALLASLELAPLAERPAAELNSAQQKMLDLARALATGPRLLLIDELAAGLNPAELERVAQKLEELAHSGIALLVVEHLMGFID